MPSTASPRPTDLSRSRRRGFTVLALIGVLLVTAGGFTAAAQSESPGQVTFFLEGSDENGPLKPITVPLTVETAGAPDIHDKTYTVREATGTRSVVVKQGWSLLQLVTSAGDNLASYRFFQVQRPNGTYILLQAGQVTKPTAFDDGPIVVYVDDQGVTQFLRPVGQADGDYNSADVFPVGSELRVRLRQSQPLTVTALPVHRKIKVGETVNFKGSATGGAAGDDLIYRWSNGKLGFSDTARNTSYRFTKKGSYNFLLSVSSRFADVTDESDPNSDTDYARIEVEPKKSTKDQPGGGANDKPDASDGAVDDSSGGVPGTGTGVPQTYTDPQANSSSSPVTSTPAPAPTQATPKPKPVKKPKPVPTQTTPATTVPTDPNEVTVEGTVLTGLSLAAASVPPPAAGAAPKSAGASAEKPVAARAGTPKELPDPTGGLHVPAGVWILLLLVLLLIGGFWQDAYRAVAPRSVPRIP